MIINNKIKAFTIAEVLITLAIIGVIAALTIPLLIQNVQDMQFKAQFKDIFADLNEAYRRMSVNNNNDIGSVCDLAAQGTGSDIDSTNCFKNEFIKYVKAVTSCDADASGNNNCTRTDNSKWLNGDDSGQAFNEWYGAGIVMLNGVMLDVYWVGEHNCSSFAGYYVDKNIRCSLGGLLIDVNGKKQPNQFGKDVYYANLLTPAILYPGGAAGTTSASDNLYGCDLTVNPNAQGWACAYVYLSGK